APSIRRSSTPGASTSTGSPADSTSMRRVGLAEARRSGSLPSQTVVMAKPRHFLPSFRSPGMTADPSNRDELHAVVAVEVEDRRGGLLDRAPGDIDDRPVVASAEAARERDLLGDPVA